MESYEATKITKSGISKYWLYKGKEVNGERWGVKKIEGWGRTWCVWGQREGGWGSRGSGRCQNKDECSRKKIQEGSQGLRSVKYIWRLWLQLLAVEQRSLHFSKSRLKHGTGKITWCEDPESSLAYFYIENCGLITQILPFFSKSGILIFKIILTLQITFGWKFAME